MCLYLFQKLPYPETTFDKTQTEDTNIEQYRALWLTIYGVPAKYWDYWKKEFDIAYSSELINPAWMWTDQNGLHIRFNIGWANPGTMAYEAAHPSWDFLADKQKTEYKITFDSLKDKEPLLKLLFHKYPHELVADIDTSGDVRISGHAAIYRFLGNQMPESLKKYYIKLF